MPLAILPPSKFSLVLQLKNRSKSIYLSGQIRYKSSQVIHLAQKLLQVFLASRSLYFLHGFNSLWINLYALLMNNEAQELPSRYTKSTFERIHLQSILTHSLKSKPQISQMMTQTGRFDHNIININFQYNTNQVMEDQIHSSLISSTSIFQSKSHNNPLKQTNKARTSKGRFRRIFFGHEYLIVSQITIKKT